MVPVPSCVGIRPTDGESRGRPGQNGRHRACALIRGLCIPRSLGGNGTTEVGGSDSVANWAGRSCSISIELVTARFGLERWATQCKECIVTCPKLPADHSASGRTTQLHPSDPPLRGTTESTICHKTSVGNINAAIVPNILEKEELEGCCGTCGDF